MNGTIVPLTLPGAAPGGTMRVATVVAAENGTATRIAMEPAAPAIIPAGQLSHVPALAPGDPVVVADSADGPIVIGRLKAPDHPPAAAVVLSNKCVTIDAPDGIQLRCGDVTIALSADGRICISGDRVVTQAGSELQLNSAVIRIN